MFLLFIFVTFKIIHIFINVLILHKSMSIKKDVMVKEKKKQVNLKPATHRKLDILTAKRQFVDFDQAVDYLLDFEYKHVKKG